MEAKEKAREYIQERNPNMPEHILEKRTREMVEFSKLQIAEYENDKRANSKGAR